MRRSRQPRLPRGQIVRHWTSMMLNWIKFRGGQSRDPFPATSPIPRSTRGDDTCTYVRIYVGKKGTLGGEEVERFMAYMRHEQGYWKVWLPTDLIRRVFESRGSEMGPPASPRPISHPSHHIAYFLFVDRIQPVARATTSSLSRKLILRLYPDVWIATCIPLKSPELHVDSKIIFEFYTSERSIVENSQQTFVSKI